MSEGSRGGTLRVMSGAIGDAGHALPVIALASALRRRGHDVSMETSERWRQAIEAQGMRFVAGETEIAGPGQAPGPSSPRTLAEVARSLIPVMREARPHVVITDVYTLAPALAAEAAGVPRATVIHHPYPVHEPGLPFFLVGLMPPRTSFGRYAWRAARPLLDLRLRWGARALNETRADLSLPPLDRPQGSVSDWLAMVATFPQLEYERSWAPHVHVTGPMLFDAPAPEVEPADGDGPLVLVAASTARERGIDLVRVALEALAGEPVRMVASLGRPGRGWDDRPPGNAVVRDWVSYPPLMAKASLVVCNGGHGTLAMALSKGAPVLVCPGGPDQAENGIRASWAGAGLMIPSRLVGPRSLRRVARRMLQDQRFAHAAERIADWSRRNDGAERGATLVERYAGERDA
jgi:UDP:flavonoid glycosyltransferase YjiC (YdhE family)